MRGTLASWTRRWAAPVVASVLVALGVPTVVAPPAAHADTVTFGDRTLTVTPAHGLDVDGQVVEVQGTGFEAGEGRGIYVAFCVVPPPGQVPSPCGGAPGQPFGGAVWVADAYGIEHGATPMNPDGSFSVQVFASPKIGTLDCRKVQCAVVTRRDHRGSTDRSQDVIVPVSFGKTNVDKLPIAALPDITGKKVPTSARIKAITKRAQPQLPVTVESADGRTVEITDVSRIVSLNGSLSEIVYSLGLGDRVVGRDISATFKEAKKVPLVTRAHDVSAESVLSRRPTVVIAQSDVGPADAIQQIRDAGVPVVLFDAPTSVEEIGARELAVAQALGVPELGEQLRARTRSELRDVLDRVPEGAKKPRVAFLYMRGQAGVYLIGGKGSGADSMIEAAGGIDAGTAIGLDKPFTPITSEALAKAAPDVILMTTTGLESVGGIDGLVEIPGIAQTPAGKQRRVITEEDGLLFSFGSRTPVALRRLVDKLYADELTDAR